MKDTLGRNSALVVFGNQSDIQFSRIFQIEAVSVFFADEPFENINEEKPSILFPYIFIA